MCIRDSCMVLHTDISSDDVTTKNKNIISNWKNSTGITWRFNRNYFSKIMLTCLSLAIASDDMNSSFWMWHTKHITWYWLWPLSSSPSTKAFSIWTSCNDKQTVTFQRFSITSPNCSEKIMFNTRYVFTVQYVQH